MPDGSRIEHVSDTAFWVAHFRAMETRRTDATFNDPFASLLAGARGRLIARSFGRSRVVAWGTVVRTCAIDRLIDDAIELGIDTVFNLGAGLDTRPYRMRLPARLRWVELDFPNIIEHKHRLLSSHQPACHLERVAIDLLDGDARRDAFAKLGSISQSTLLITEGVIPFIAKPDVETLARDLNAIPSFRYWITDFANMTSKRKMPKGWRELLKAAPYLFETDVWITFFEGVGWHACKLITTSQESDRIGRPYPLDFPKGLMMRMLPDEVRRRLLDLSGAVLMQKGEAARATASLRV